MGLVESVGTLGPGKTADLVGLKGNPLQDIRALGKVGTVICRGTLFYSEAEGIN